ncbi:dienelactone hydrolase family protein [Cupriavidus basilensis]|uniref:Dienelactone hydrolase family protein n=2 Tax=Cupriavidus basilensis TaxID=68895 RepID=A0ABT6AKC3_9BURK|nr:dienelactone hydrolase family protein [Cupriavidus basilensis]MDF3833041.1 dienelactone hydrolase family protein [Cupriavidus basilensis]
MAMPRRAARHLWSFCLGLCAMLAASHAALAQASAPAAGGQAMPVAQMVQFPGAGNGTALSAYWFVPSRSAVAQSQALPVVIALHGCGGLHRRGGADAAALQPRYREYVQWLSARGYAVLLPDSFGPRGKPQGICTERIDGRDIDDATRRGDVLEALRWLAQQPGIDTGHIVLLGWSNGAQAVLSAVDASREWPAGAPAIERAVAFYPGCKSAVQRHAFRLRTPLLLMTGGADDWTPATRCAMLREAVAARQPDARFRLEIYPGAYHGFDGTERLRVRRDVPNGTRPGQGVTQGGDPAAREAALAQLDSWLASPNP